MKKNIARVEVSESAKLFSQATQRVLKKAEGQDREDYQNVFLSNSRAQDKANNYERHRVRNKRQGGIDRWKFESDKLRKAIEEKLRGGDDLGGIVDDKTLLGKTKHILAIHKHSKLDSVAERWAWNRGAWRDRKREGEVPEAMAKAVLNDIVHTMVNTQAEHVGRLTDPTADPNKRLVFQGLSKLNDDADKALILQAARLGYSLKAADSALKEAIHLNKPDDERQLLQTKYNYLVEALSELSIDLKEKNKAFDDIDKKAPSSPETAFDQRQAAIAAYTQAKQLAPITPETAEVSFRTYVADYAIGKEEDMKNMAPIARRPEFIKNIAEVYVGSKRQADAWTSSMERVQEYQVALNNARNNEESLSKVKEEIQRKCDIANRNFNKAHDDIFSCGHSMSLDNRRKRGSARIAQAQAVPYLLLHMQLLNEDYAIIDGDNTAKEQDRREIAANAFGAYLEAQQTKAQQSAAKQPAAQVPEYLANDFMQRVFEVESRKEGFESDHRQYWDKFLASEDPAAYAEEMTKARSLSLTKSTLIHLANAEAQRIAHGGRPRPDSAKKTQVVKEEGKRQEMAFDALKGLARQMAHGNITSLLNYPGTDFVAQARQAVTAEFNKNKKLDLRADMLRRFASVEVSGNYMMQIGKLQQAANNFIETINTKKKFNPSMLYKLERFIQVAEHIRLNGQPLVEVQGDKLYKS